MTESTPTIEWDEDESIHIRQLREVNFFLAHCVKIKISNPLFKGALNAAATIFLLRDDIRPVLSDPLLLQFLSASLDYPAVGVRYVVTLTSSLRQSCWTPLS